MIFAVDSIEYKGKDYKIRTDFRDIIQIILAFEDKELLPVEQYNIMFDILFKDEKPPMDEISIKACIDFLDAGLTPSDVDNGKVYSWKTDGSYIINDVSIVAGFPLRTVPYLHWFDFLGYFYNVGDGTFARVVNIRTKRNKGKKLDESELEFYKNNMSLVDSLRKTERDENGLLKVGTSVSDLDELVRLAEIELKKVGGIN